LHQERADFAVSVVAVVAVRGDAVVREVAVGGAKAV
jgi:hypothetical protein